MIGWHSDNPFDRHQWLVAQATRVACLHRNGCLTAAGLEQAHANLTGVFHKLINHGGKNRAPGRGEIADALGWGQTRAAAKNDIQLAAELGNHTHPGPLDQLAAKGALHAPPSHTPPTLRSVPTGGDVGPHPPLSGSVASGDTDNREHRDDSPDPAPAGTPEDAAFQLEAQLVAHHLHIQDAAKQIERARKAGLTPAPDLTPLTEFLAVQDPPITYRIDQLLPVGAHVLVTAQFKAGKSTLMGNLLRCLADGDKFLDTFEVHQPDGAIVLIDDELDERTLRRWVRDQGIQNTHRVHVKSLRGKVSSFDLLNPTIRAQWATLLKGVNCAFLIFDCLRPVLDALGLSEDKEAGQFLVQIDALCAEAGVGEAALVHHMGHGGERARGDSRLRDWADNEWRLIRDVAPGEENPSAPRYFAAYGRDVDVPEGSLSYETIGRRLTYREGSRKDVNGDGRAPINALPDVLALLAESPPLPKQAIEAEMIARGHKRSAVRQALDSGRATSMILIERGERGAQLHYLNPSRLADTQLMLASSPARRDLAGEVTNELAAASVDRRRRAENGELKTGELGELKTPHPFANYMRDL